MSQSWNFNFFTFGGLQLWCDRLTYNGWRIQENHWSKRCRLLDNHNIRRFRGNYTECVEALEKFKKVWEMPTPTGHLVVLISGLFGTSRSFNKMKKYLKENGYNAVAISYPSTRLDFKKHIENFEIVLNNLVGIETVSFVGFGLGALIARELVSQKAKWQQKIKIGRLVQIAPPNNGSMLATKFNKYSLIRFLFGPCLKTLNPEIVKTFTKPDCEFGIIVGGQNDEKGFCPFFFKGDNDTIVKIEESRIEGFSDFVVVNNIHSFLVGSFEVIKLVEHFLSSGRFAKGKKIKKEVKFF